MNKPPSVIPAVSHRLVSRDGAGIFAFIRTLRLAVRAKVAAEQNSGVPFAEIAIHVREMISLSEDAARQSGARSSAESRTIAKRADAWCVDAYDERTKNVESVRASDLEADLASHRDEARI